MADDLILSLQPIDFQWPTLDPFLFCVHHDDAYPPGNEQLGVDPDQLRGRRIGMDFELRDGWRMYHGDVVPGFPRHPHRGFETVTVVRHGLIDHSDSMGAAGRYGHGDVQWMTAGKGIEHAEMFPLVHRDRGNRGELFQIWLNLPAVDKFADPHFTMFWNRTIPRETLRDDDGRATELTLFAGAFGGQIPPAPPPNSWASRAEADLAIWTLRMEPGARWAIPPASADANRMLYFFAGEDLAIGGETVERGHAFQVPAGIEVPLVMGGVEGELLMLQGRPIGEPVAQQGPFVMNTADEIRQAYTDYQAGTFGRWPWDRTDPVHGADRGRFARHADGREEEPG